MLLFTESAKFCATHALVLYVPCALLAFVPHVPRVLCALVLYVTRALHFLLLTCLVLYVLSCLMYLVFCVPCVLSHVLMCSGAPNNLCLTCCLALRTSCPKFSRFLLALASHALILDESCTLLTIVPYVLSHLKCLTSSSTSYILCLKRFCATRASYPTCSSAPCPLLDSGVSSLTCSYVSHVS